METDYAELMRLDAQLEAVMTAQKQAESALETATSEQGRISEQLLALRKEIQNLEALAQQVRAASGTLSSESSEHSGSRGSAGYNNDDADEAGPGEGHGGKGGNVESGTS